MNTLPAKKILIIQTAFIGDTILMSSFAHEVHKLMPKSEIHLLVRKGNQITVEGLEWVNKVWIWDKTKNKLKSLFSMSNLIRHEKFDIVFNLHRHASSGFIAFQSKAPIIVGFNENPFSYFYTHKKKHLIPHQENDLIWHEVQRNASLIKLLNADYEIPQNPSSLKPFIPVKNVNLEKVLPLQTEPYVIIAPASVWFTKQWPEEYFTELAQKIASKCNVYLIGGPDDRDLCERVRADHPRIENLCGKLNLIDSAALMKKAKRVIVNDSSPLHLASGVNAKITAIFCSTIKEFGYFPQSDSYKVLEIEKKLECRPCGLHGKKDCPKKHFECGFGISVESVFKTIDF